MSVLSTLDQIVESGIRLDTNARIYNRDLSAYINADASGFTVTGTWSTTGVIAAPSGTAAAPGYTFSADTDLGLYRVAANQLGVALGGVAGLCLAGSAPTFAAATNTAGQDLYLRAADAGSTPTSALAGGLVSFLAGAGSAGSAGTGTVDAGAGGAMSLGAGAGGAATSTAGAQGGNGGATTLLSGAGGSAAGTDPGGNGGALALTGGAGGAKTGTGAAAGGVGSSITVTAGVGGATASSGANAGGAGGSVTATAGNGGAASAGTGNGGAGGDVVVQPGTGGSTTGGTAGRAGIVRQHGPVFASCNTTATGTVGSGGTATVAQVRGRVLYQDASGGNVTMTSPTGASLDAEFPTLAAGLAIFIVHASNHATNTSTIAGGVGITLVGSGAVTSTGGQYMLLKTGTATYEMTRCG